MKTDIDLREDVRKYVNSLYFIKLLPVRNLSSRDVVEATTRLISAEMNLVAGLNEALTLAMDKVAPLGQKLGYMLLAETRKHKSGELLLLEALRLDMTEFQKEHEGAVQLRLASFQARQGRTLQEQGVLRRYFQDVYQKIGHLYLNIDFSLSAEEGRVARALLLNPTREMGRQVTGPPANANANAVTFRPAPVSRSTVQTAKVAARFGSLGELARRAWRGQESNYLARWRRRK